MALGEELQLKEGDGSIIYCYCYICERLKKPQELPIVSSGGSSGGARWVRWAVIIEPRWGRICCLWGDDWGRRSRSFLFRSFMIWSWFSTFFVPYLFLHLLPRLTIYSIYLIWSSTASAAHGVGLGVKSIPVQSNKITGCRGLFRHQEEIEYRLNIYLRGGTMLAN